MSKSQMAISGRIVWSLSPTSNPMERVTQKNRQTGQVVFDKAGQPVQTTTFSLAVPKGSPQQQQLEELKKVEILKIYPSGQVPKTFAFKTIDGDTDIDDKGRPYSQREGHAGHIIIAFNTRFAVNWYQFDGVNYNEINSGVKVGDYVDVNFTIAAHGPNPNGGVAGFYIEPKAMLFTGVGDAIERKTQAVDPAKFFGAQPMQQPAAQPQQMFAQPQAAPMQQPAQFQQPVAQPAWGQQQAAPAWGQQVQQAAPAQFQQPVQQPQQPAQPYYGGLPPQFQK